MKSIQMCLAVLMIICCLSGCNKTREPAPAAVPVQAETTQAEPEPEPTRVYTPVYKVSVTQLKASSTLPDDEQLQTESADRKRTILYSAYNLFDEFPKTAWVEGKQDAGIGEKIEITFSAKIVFDAIEVLPGYFIDAFFRQNNRVKTITLNPGRGRREQVHFQDLMEPQKHSFDPPIETEQLTIILDAVFKGEQWDDTCLSGLSFFFADRQLEIQTGSFIYYLNGAYQLRPFSSLQVQLAPAGKGNYDPAPHFTLQAGGELSGDLAPETQMGNPLNSGGWLFDEAHATFHLSYEYEAFEGTPSMDGSGDGRWVTRSDSMWLPVYSNTQLATPEMETAWLHVVP